MMSSIKTNIVFISDVKQSRYLDKYNGADKSLAWSGRKQAIVSVRMVWISFGALPCRKKETWWQFAYRCCWNRRRPWHASELVSFPVGLRTYQHHGNRVSEELILLSKIWRQKNLPQRWQLCAELYGSTLNIQRLWEPRIKYRMLVIVK